MDHNRAHRKSVANKQSLKGEMHLRIQEEWQQQPRAGEVFIGLGTKNGDNAKCSRLICAAALAVFGEAVERKIRCLPVVKVVGDEDVHVGAHVVEGLEKDFKISIIFDKFEFRKGVLVAQFRVPLEVLKFLKDIVGVTNMEACTTVDVMQLEGAYSKEKCDNFLASLHGRYGWESSSLHLTIWKENAWSPLYHCVSVYLDYNYELTGSFSQFLQEYSCKYMKGELAYEGAGEFGDSQEAELVDELNKSGWIVEEFEGKKVARARRGAADDAKIAEAKATVAVGAGMSRSLPSSRPESSFSVLEDLSAIAGPRTPARSFEQHVLAARTQSVVQADVTLSPMELAMIFLALEEEVIANSYVLSLLNSYYPMASKGWFVIYTLKLDLERLHTLWNNLYEEERRFVQKQYLQAWMPTQAGVAGFDPRHDPMLKGQKENVRAVVLKILFPGNNICGYLALTAGLSPLEVTKLQGPPTPLLSPKIAESLLQGTLLEYIGDIPAMVKYLMKYDGKSLAHAAYMLDITMLQHNYNMPDVRQRLSLNDDEEDDQMDQDSHLGPDMDGVPDWKKMPGLAKADLDWVQTVETLARIDAFQDVPGVSSSLNPGLEYMKVPKIWMDKANNKFLYEVNWTPAIVSAYLFSKDSAFYKKRKDSLLNPNEEANKQKIKEAVAEYVRSRKFQRIHRLQDGFWKQFTIDWWKHVDDTKILRPGVAAPV